MKLFEIHLVTWKRPKMTELVVKTIKRNTPASMYNLRIWDNNADNIGLEKARQNLLMTAKTPYFICADNDVLPQKDWLPRLYELWQKYEDYAAIACRTQVMVGTGNIFEEADKNELDLVDFPHPGGSFRLMKTSITKEVGGWDRESGGRGSEERYICGKLRDAGYKTGFATNIKCLHLFGDKSTDNWGYDKKMQPEESGHSSGVWHPIFDRGDDIDEVLQYADKKDIGGYFNVNSDNTQTE